MIDVAPKCQARGTGQEMASPKNLSSATCWLSYEVNQ